MHTIVHVEENGCDNFPIFLPDGHHYLDVVYWGRETITSLYVCVCLSFMFVTEDVVEVGLCLMELPWH